MKYRSLAIPPAACLCFISAAFAFSGPAQAQPVVEVCSSTGDTINLRAGPGTNHRVLASIENATQLTVLRGDVDDMQAWLEVELTEPAQVYVLGAQLRGFILSRLTTRAMCRVLHDPVVATTSGSVVGDRPVTLGPWDFSHDLHLDYEGHPEMRRIAHAANDGYDRFYLETEATFDPYPHDTAESARRDETAMPVVAAAPPMATGGLDPFDRRMRRECAYEDTAAISTPTRDFINTGEGTVLHTTTNLTWYRCPVGMLWRDNPPLHEEHCYRTERHERWNDYRLLYHTEMSALIAGTTIGGRQWRLPTTRELLTLLETACEISPPLNHVIFPVMQGDVWSSEVSTVRSPYHSTVWFTQAYSGVIGSAHSLHERRGAYMVSD